jgi:hypothetical protein
MAINFPDSPSDNDIYTVNGKRWIYSNGKWSIYGTTAPDATASDTEPSGVGDGHIWYRSDESQTLIRYDNTWVEVGSAGGFDNASTNFPTSLDSATGFAAVEALQAKVGADSSAVTSSLDYKVADHASRLTTLEGLGDLTTYTPTWTNLTVGNATQDFAYCVVNDLMFIQGRVVWGSTTSMSTNPAFSIPSGYQSAVPGYNAVGHLNMRDSGTGEYFGQVKGNGVGSTTCLLKTSTVNATYGAGGAINGGIPFTWTTSDEILLTVTISVTAV